MIATAVHGNHREAQQQESASKFNAGTLNIIITTDMILKTLALENIKLVVTKTLEILNKMECKIMCLHCLSKSTSSDIYH